jgi:glutathione peroxidase
MKLFKLFSMIAMGAFMHTSVAQTPILDKIELKTLEKKMVPGSSLKGNVLLVVNTASKCGYTPQLKALQTLHTKYKDQGLKVIGAPSNDFNQETLGEKELVEFCKFNYGVEFTMLEKLHVNGPKRHALYQYLIDQTKEQGDISWNFEKFLVGKDGKVIARYKSGVSPDDPKLVASIESALKASGK